MALLDGLRGGGSGQKRFPQVPVKFAAFAVLALAAGGCRGPRGGLIPRNPSWRGGPGGGTYVSAYLGPVDRRQTAGDPVADGFLYGGTIGQELSSGPVRPAFEIDGSWSNHDVDLVGVNDDVDVTIGRVAIGGRISFDVWRVTPYVRAGGFYRWDTELRRDNSLGDVDLAIDSQDERGVYYGGGIEFWVDWFGSIGPAVTWYDGLGDQELDELFIGFVGHTHF